jgi:hypothetical protein
MNPLEIIDHVIADLDLENSITEDRVESLILNHQVKLLLRLKGYLENAK